MEQFKIIEGGRGGRRNADSEQREEQHDSGRRDVQHDNGRRDNEQRDNEQRGAQHGEQRESDNAQCVVQHDSAQHGEQSKEQSGEQSKEQRGEQQNSEQHDEQNNDVSALAADALQRACDEEFSFSALDVPNRRWAWADIDLEAIRQNTKAIRKHVGAHVDIMAVVKDDGYGHGAVEVARAALSSGARYLGVATVQEGINLREAGIEAPVLVLAEPPIETIPFVIRHKLMTTVYTAEFALALGETADAQGATAQYHLKIDTGMNRLGVHYSDAGDFLRSIDFHRGLELNGVFTHLATADDTDTFELRRQLDRLNHAVETIRYMGINPGIVHAANSAALIRFRETHFDMVRPGIALYGIHSSEATRGAIKLRPAMSIHARVNLIKPVPIGEGVSYNFIYRSPGGVHIATIPIGYGDGLSRVLSNRMDVLVDGRAYPQVGNICMDMCMFEVDQRSSVLKPRQEVKVGDKVTIIGRSGNLEISIEDMAHALGTISYELLCCFGLRLNKNYLNQ